MAERLQIPYRTYQSYEGKNDAPKTALLRKLGQDFSVNVDFLLFGRGAMFIDDATTYASGSVTTINQASTNLAHPIDEGGLRMFKDRSELGDDFILLPRYEVRAAAGSGAVVHSEQIVDHLAFKVDWVRYRLRRQPANLGLIEAMGDSMEPTISDGDLLLVDFSEGKVRDNAIYAISANGDLIVKRIQRNPISGAISIISDNPRYQPIVLSAPEAEQLRVVGQVCWHGGLI